MNRRPLRAVTDDELRAFEADGVVCVRGMFDDAWIAFMRSAVDYMLAHPTAVGMNLNTPDIPGRHAFDNYLWTVSEDFRTFAFDSPVAELAASFMRSRRVNLAFDFMLVKEPHTASPTRWHQDQPGSPIDGWQNCSIWIALDKVTPESGAVEFVRGSHKWTTWYEPLFSGDPYKHSHYRHFTPEQGAVELEPMPDIGGNKKAYDILTYSMAPGDFTIHHPMISHGGPGNATARRRRAFGYRFAGGDATYAVRKNKNSVRPIVDPGLEAGDPFPDDPHHHIFPRLWPRASEATNRAVA